MGTDGTSGTDVAALAAEVTALRKQFANERARRRAWERRLITRLAGLEGRGAYTDERLDDLLRCLVQNYTDAGEQAPQRIAAGLPVSEGAKVYAFPAG